jgi:hypothetical protein
MSTLNSLTKEIKDFGRILQNVNLTKQAKIDHVLVYECTDQFSLRSKQEIQTLLSLFPLSIKEREDNCSIIEEIIAKNLLKKQKKLLFPGIEII